jgi:hypothetical protein
VRLRRVSLSTFTAGTNKALAVFLASAAHHTELGLVTGTAAKAASEAFAMVNASIAVPAPQRSRFAFKTFVALLAVVTLAAMLDTVSAVRAEMLGVVALCAGKATGASTTLRAAAATAYARPANVTDVFRVERLVASWARNAVAVCSLAHLTVHARFLIAGDGTTAIRSTSCSNSGHFNL